MEIKKYDRVRFVGSTWEGLVVEVDRTRQDCIRVDWDDDQMGWHYPKDLIKVTESLNF